MHAPHARARAVPTFEAYSTWQLPRLKPPGKRGKITWVTQPWRLIQDPKAPPLHLTPATSAQLQRAILASAAAAARSPVDDARALVSSTVTVSFGIRTTLPLDGGAALGALRGAFSRVTGGLAAARISVRLLSPTEAVLEAGAGHLVVVEYGTAEFQPRGHHRRALGLAPAASGASGAAAAGAAHARRGLQQQEPGQTDPNQLPEKQVGRERAPGARRGNP